MDPVEETRPETTSFFELLVEATPRFFVTTVLVSLNVGYFLTMLLMGASVLMPESTYLLGLGANFGPLTITGQSRHFWIHDPTYIWVILVTVIFSVFYFKKLLMHHV